MTLDDLRAKALATDAPQPWRELQEAMAEELVDIDEVTRLVQAGELVVGPGESMGHVLERWRQERTA